jgi:hypothetical protein
MQRDKWINLDDKSKEIWDQLDDKAKYIILGYDAKSSGTGSFQNSSVKKHPPFQRQVNMHDMSAYEFIQACLHNVDHDSPIAPVDIVQSDMIPNETVGNEEPQEEPSSLLVNAAKSSGYPKLLPGDIRRVVSKVSKRYVNQCEYYISAHNQSSTMSLVDRGANGGVAGADVRVIFKTHRNVDIKGIDNHQVTDIPIGTVGGVISTQKGPVIAIMHQYALLGKGSSIHAPCQMESYKNEVNDRSIHVPGGLQCIKTLDGYIIPLRIHSGLARLPIRPYTDEEWDRLPNVMLTAETEWDPSTIDHEFPPDEQWGGTIDEHKDLPCTHMFDEYGDYRKRVIVQHASYFLRHDSNVSLEDIIDQCVYHSQDPCEYNIFLSSNQIHDQGEPHGQTDDSDALDPIAIPKHIHKRSPDYGTLRPFFGWLSPDIIQKTFENTTQYARIPSGTLLKRTFKSPNPALNVTRRNEAVACDIVYADTPAIHDGSTSAVIFVGVETQVTDVYGIKTDKQFVNTLEDNIIQRGAPNKLISDRAQVLISNKVVDILRNLCIGSWQSEPHQQQQNPAERRFQTLKTSANRIMDRTGAPPYTWLLCLGYVCFLLNHTYNMTLRGVPLTLLTGTTVDISGLLRFYFWQKVYYKAVETDFPSETTEAVGHIVGISEHCGHALTWKILTPDTKTIIFHSLVRPFTSDDPNLRAELLGGEEDDPIINEVDPIIQSRLSADGEPK